MADLQHIAARIFRHVDAGGLTAGYANVMGALIDADADDPDFHEWAATVPDSSIEKLIACMVRKGAWNNLAWLREYVWEARQKETAV